MFIFKLRFPPGVSIATMMDMYGYKCPKLDLYSAQNSAPSTYKSVEYALEFCCNEYGQNGRFTIPNNLPKTLDTAISHQKN